MNDAVSKSSRELITGHDGFVPYSSCKLTGRLYTTSSSSAFYATSTNHDDGRCAYGEGKASNQQPCSWLTNQLAAGQARFSKFQEFRDGSKTGGVPRATPRAPAFGAFKYDDVGTKAWIQEQLSDQDAKTTSLQPVGALAKKPAPHREPKAPTPKSPSDLIKLSPAQIKKANDEAKAAEKENLKKYEAAMAE